MARTLISAENGFMRNVAGFAVAAVLIPLAVIVKLIILPFERPIKRPAAEVLGYLRAFRDGTGDDYDWDYFTSVPIADPQLEQLRIKALSLDLPFGVEEFQSLDDLIATAETLVRLDHLA